MDGTQEYLDRLKRATEHRIERDGAVWYSAWHVCTALRYNYDEAKKYVLPGDKLTVRSNSRLEGIKNTLYFSPRGVEAVICLKGGLPRKRMLEALA